MKRKYIYQLKITLTHNGLFSCKLRKEFVMFFLKNIGKIFWETESYYIQKKLVVVLLAERLAFRIGIFVYVCLISKLF